VKNLTLQARRDVVSYTSAAEKAAITYNGDRRCTAINRRSLSASLFSASQYGTHFRQTDTGVYSSVWWKWLPVYRLSDALPSGVQRSASVTIQISLFSQAYILPHLSLLAFAVYRRPSVCRLSVCLSVCLSVVCNVRAPYSADWNFRQYFYAFWFVGHLLTSA